MPAFFYFVVGGLGCTEHHHGANRREEEEDGMPVFRKRDPLVLGEEQIRRLQAIQSSRNISRSTLVRARILLRYVRNESISEIARREGVTRPTVQLCIDKALSGGVETAIRDLSRPGRPSSVTAEDKAWVMHLACAKPTAYGEAKDLWTLSQLTDYVQKHALETGHFSLEGVQKDNRPEDTEGIFAQPSQCCLFFRQAQP